MVSAIRDLARLRAPGRGLFASGGVLFSDAIFGRDSVTAADNLLYIQPAISREIILTLARLQGVVESPTGPHSNEEQPGKIHHEHRSLFIDSRRVSQASELLVEELGRRWGGDGTSVTYYGSTDATPLYARLVARFCAAHGMEILAESFVRRDGREATIRDSLVAAMDWITCRMDTSDLGFVEFQRRNPDGIPFQVWKDSGTSYIHRDSTLANWDAPIAAIEVQAYAYDALLGAGDVLGRPDWRERAADLRRQILDRLWMAEDGYFAMGLDRDANGEPRLIDSIASNGALVLDTRLLDGLPDGRDIAEGLVRCICSPDFVTDVGIRSRTLAEVNLIGFQDYHGAWTVWPRETFEVLRGLDRQRFSRLARQLANRLLNGVNVARANLEFFYVSPEGKVMYDFEESDLGAGERATIVGTNRPEAPIAWTVTAALAVKWWYGAGREICRSQASQDGWRGSLDLELASGIANVPCLRTRAECDAAWRDRGDFVLDLKAGRAHDRRARETRRGEEVLPV